MIEEVRESAMRRANPNWTAARERAVRERIDRARAGRRTSRAVFATAFALALTVLGVGSVQRALESTSPAPVTSAGRATSTPLLSFEDGSQVLRVSPEARVTTLEVSPSVTRLRLERGAARFEVSRNEQRLFQVVAPGVTVTVLGTAFRVAITAAGVRTDVERGRVSVECWSESRELTAGQEQLCPAAPSSVVELAPAPSAESPQPSTSAPISARPRASVSWRGLAQDGDYRGAYARMLAEGRDAVRDEPADLLFAADVARLSGHAGDAIARLERVVRLHSGDSRAPLAAFTLGRTLLDELGRPREAAEAFATSRRLAPAGALTQDALAREVESWSRAGEARLARERALQYVNRYPAGRRLKAVRHHGGLDERE